MLGSYTRRLALLASTALSILPGPSLAKPGPKWLGFKTEPTLTYETFNITQFPDDSQQLAPGYLFMDILFEKEGWGPQIYDIHGTPVWLGPVKYRSQNLHVCDYEGQTAKHLCYFVRGDKQPFPKFLPIPKDMTYGYGDNVVLDDAYKPIKNFSHGFKNLPINGHAFQMMPGGNTYLSPVSYPVITDLRPYGGDKKGYVKNHCIDEIDVHSSKSVFHWCYLEAGLPIWETQTYFESSRQHTNASHKHFGKGTKRRPWDFLHFNSNDKTAEGDYYVSFRHGDQIIKVAGLNNTKVAPGTVLWRLGGRSTNFKFEGFANDPPFSRQHDVRAISMNGSEEILSIFNNGADSALPEIQSYSEGLVIKVNTETWVASLERSYPHPYGRLSRSRGSVQTLPNNNIMVGYGVLPELSEFDHNGTLLYHALFSRGFKNPEFSYRVLKYPWKATPYWSPRLVAYCRQCGSPHKSPAPLVAYVSWNGATEIRRWKFSTASHAQGPWTSAGTFDKTGFETKAELIRFPNAPRAFRAYVRAEAIDEDGAVLGSTIAKTFVPKSKLKSKCNDEECRIASFEYGDADSVAWMCEIQSFSAFGGVVTLSLFTEAVSFVFQNMLLLRRFWI